MSYKAVDIAIVTDAPSHAAKLVMICLAKHYNHLTGKCCPSYERMAEMMGIAKSSVTRAIKELIDAGLITKRKGSRQGSHEGPNHYRLIFYSQARLAEINERKRLRYGDVHVPMVRPQQGSSPSPLRSEGESALKPKRKRSQRRLLKTRMTEDWKLTKRGREFAQERGIPADQIDKTCEHFRLWWISVGEVKADWLRTWYMWVNKQLDIQEKDNERASSSGPRRGPQFSHDGLGELHAAVQELSAQRRRREGGGEDGVEQSSDPGGVPEG